MTEATPPDEPTPPPVGAPPIPEPTPPAPQPTAPTPVTEPLPTPPPVAEPAWPPAAPVAAAPPPAPPGPPPAPSAASESWNAAAPRKRKLTWLWVLLGVLGVVAVLVVIAVVLFVRSITGPIDATNNVLAQIKAGQYQTAYRISCSTDRAKYTEDQYAQAFKDTVSQLGGVKSYDVNYSSVSGSRASVRYDITFAGGKTSRLEGLALKTAGNWRACLLSKQ